MQKTILLVGPSGAGKTSAFESIQQEFDSIHFRHLDGLASRWAVRNGWIDRESVCLLRDTLRQDELFLAVGLQAIADFAARHGDKDIVIDVGAGFQQAVYADKLPMLYRTIAIVPSPESAHIRWTAKHNKSRGDLKEYAASEYSEKRLRLYASCQHTIDNTNLSLGETGHRLASLLRTIIGFSGR